MRKLMAGLRGKLAANMAQKGMEPDMADRAGRALSVVMRIVVVCVCSLRRLLTVRFRTNLCTKKEAP